MTLTCFKAYDIRGKLDSELNEAIAYRIGRAFGAWLASTTLSHRASASSPSEGEGNPSQPPSRFNAALRPLIRGGVRAVVVGGDVRLSTEALKKALIDGLLDAGLDVIDIGVTGTEEVYFATFHLGVAGGIEVTASHNPIDYNGMKLVKAGSQPLSNEEFVQVRQLAELNAFPPMQQRGNVIQQTILNDYVAHLLGYLSAEYLQQSKASVKPLTLVVNAGNGAAGHVIDALEQQFIQRQIPIHFIKIQHEPDGTFPHGIPNPLLPEGRAATTEAVLKHQVDMGIAWDGDFDRCFLFDERGRFIEGYYIVGLLAEMFLQQQAGAKIVHDPRLTWNTIDVVKSAGGIPIQSKTGHAFIKATMRAEDAIYGGEMSAHHYFRDFAYCDSGMIPWLLVAQLMSIKNKPLSTLVDERIQLYPCSGEINFRVKDVQDSIAKVKEYFDKPLPSPSLIKGGNQESHFPLVENHFDKPLPSPPLIKGGNQESCFPVTDTTDGLSMAFSDWRFNLRGSNTEPVLRLNVESRENAELMQIKTEELRGLLQDL